MRWSIRWSCKKGRASLRKRYVIDIQFSSSQFETQSVCTLTLNIHALQINTCDFPSHYPSTTEQNSHETQPQHQSHEHIHTARLLARVPSPLDGRSHKRTTSIIPSLWKMVWNDPTFTQTARIEITHLPWGTLQAQTHRHSKCRLLRWWTHWFHKVQGRSLEW